ncbi:hypothetical protein TIFTF001_031173 [Ficus carica]|uniref:Uncharacterized protein n=1 Tax=Ficus carica TaxID=3494 RepID=A0AA88J4S6_FICCA|nr:hypothetical protein TIFTF001_031173 [Ficus carica]
MPEALALPSFNPFRTAAVAELCPRKRQRDFDGIAIHRRVRPGVANAAVAGLCLRGAIANPALRELIILVIYVCWRLGKGFLGVYFCVGLPPSSSPWLAKVFGNLGGDGVREF